MFILRADHCHYAALCLRRIDPNHDASRPHGAAMGVDLQDAVAPGHDPPIPSIRD
jgi:hypothetical protein